MPPDPQKPFFSICVPTHGRLTFLPEALKSCLAQTWPDFEVVVSDDTPDDSVRPLVEKFGPGKIFFHFQQSSFFSLTAKLNDFPNKARGEWLVILGDDDVLEPRFLEALASRIREFPSARLFRTRENLIDKHGRSLGLDPANPLVMEPAEFIAKTLDPLDGLWRMTITGVVFRPADLERFGGFRDYHRGRNTDRIAWIQIGSLGPSVCEPEPLCRIRLHDASITTGPDPDFQKALDTYRRFKKDVERVFEDLRSRGIGETELAPARQALKDYFRRDEADTLDQAFVGVLRSNGSGLAAAFRGLMENLNELSVPLNRRMRFYAAVRGLPGGLRDRLLDQMIRYRQRRIQAYIEKHGRGF